MYKLKYLILIFFMITISFLLCAAVPPSKKIEHNFDLYINIPKQHKIKILILGGLKNNGYMTEVIYILEMML